MSLPISTVVDVTITFSPKPKELASFGKLLFVTDEQPVSPMVGDVDSYSTHDEVVAAWGANSETAKADLTFRGSGGKDFMVVQVRTVSSPAKLTSGAVGALSSIQLVKAGGFDITVNGSMTQVRDLDFSSATSVTEVAEILDTALTGASVAVANGNLVLTSVANGANSEISFATNDISDTALMLGLTQSVGAVRTPVQVPETPSVTVARADDYDPTFWGIMTHKKYRDTAAIDSLAAFANATKRCLFNTTHQVEALTKDAVNSTVGKLKAKTYDGVLSHYSSYPDEYPSAAVAGRAMLVNFEGTNTMITLNLKSIPGVTVERLRTSELNGLKSNNCNVVVDVAGENVYSDSRMASGLWFDAYHGVSWFRNRVEVGVFNRLRGTPTRVPYTDGGVEVLVTEVERACRQAVTNGLCAPGHNAQGEYLPLGYRIIYIPVADVAAADKGNRIYRGMSVELVGAGALHEVVITGNFNE
ncbi:tail sheath [Shewanella phage Spp001]|uniref:Tail sheath protein n=1 Tax=Shewanella phage Spp001 TaxID=1445859 RepID=W6E8D4_9CAUD|nr:tail sheath [Shewanella phage Spp001]AHJ10522.1 hypothetical protein Spp001_14 [Shewanella phage Spp001]